ncbi:MAG: exodeoxyribonuclease VII large subunit [Blastocatellia bacterium]|nr:exodeoxyribonuclease VII large subunit [Blastocatellia bacterium]
MSKSLLQSLFDETEERRPLTVSEINLQVRSEIERRFASVWVEGEIVNFMDARSGHWYFTLHDGLSQLKAACYKGSNYKIRFQPFDGLQVRVRGRLTLYEPKGEYQMMVESLEPVGEGALKVAFEQIRSKLAAEGLFDEAIKRPLPAFPKKIGVVTSPTGAAFFDILHVLSRRARSVSIILIPTRVQGETAGYEISQAIRFANQFNAGVVSKDKIDVLIVGRGGGSAEDLWAFNEELVARTIRLSEIPVISAVGHEVDFTIADFAADLRAATPSAAAEIVAQKEEDICRYLESRTSDLEQLINYRLLKAQSGLQSLSLSRVFVEFPNSVKELDYEINDLQQRMRSIILENSKNKAERLALATARLSPLGLTAKLGGYETRLALLGKRQIFAGSEIAAIKAKDLGIMMAKLDALSPLSVLNRGFSITEKENGEIVRNSKQTQTGDKLNIRLANGKLSAEVLASE